MGENGMFSRRKFLRMSLAAGAALAFSDRNKEVIHAFAKSPGSYAIQPVAAPDQTLWNKDLLTSPWVVKEDFTSVAQWTGTTGGTVTQDPGGGLVFTTTGGAGTNVYSRKTVALGVLAPALWRLKFKMMDANCRSIDL